MPNSDADPRRDWSVRRAAWPGLHPFRELLPRHRSGAPSVCGTRTIPIKISRLRLWNRSRRPRRLSVTGYVEWVLGTVPGSNCALHCDRNGSRIRSHVRTQPLEHRLRRACGMCRTARETRSAGLPTGRSSLAGTDPLTVPPLL